MRAPLCPEGARQLSTFLHYPKHAIGVKELHKSKQAKLACAPLVVQIGPLPEGHSTRLDLQTRICVCAVRCVGRP